jgi:hypothetical protein
MLGLDHISRVVVGVAAVGRGAANRTADAAGRQLLATLDAVLESELAEQMVERVLASSLAKRAVKRALAGELVDTAGEGLARNGTVDRICEPLIASGELDRLVEAALESASMSRLTDRVIDSPAAERVVARAIDGPLLDEAVARLLESEELWLLVDEIARSPAVTDAIGSQGLGFADQVAGMVRDRSASADDRLETAIRGLIRRRRSRSAPVIPPPGEP